MDSKQKRRLTYVITAIAGAVIVILAVILMQQPIPTSTTPQVKKAPTVSTLAATDLGQTVATLHGNLGGVGTAATLWAGFLYGTNPSLSGATNISVGSETQTTAFFQGLTGLSAGTGYYFRAWALGDGFSTGSILTFTTLTQPSPQVHAPSVATNAPSSVSQASATLNGNLQSLGTASTVTVGFLYSTNADLTGGTNVSLGAESATGVFNQPVTGLTASTAYYVQAWALGNGFASGSVVPFTTAASSGPGGNGNHVPPGWAHAACPDVPHHAKAYGVRARCEFNMTYGEMKKEHLTFTAQPALTPNAALRANEHSAWMRAADPGNSGDHRSDNSRQF
jgi:hypothetical protein